MIRTRQFLTIVGTASELERLVGVLEVVLDVSHLVVDGDQVLQVDARAHLDPERFSQFCSVVDVIKLFWGKSRFPQN